MRSILAYVSDGGGGSRRARSARNRALHTTSSATIAAPAHARRAVGPIGNSAPAARMTAVNATAVSQRRIIGAGIGPGSIFRFVQVQVAAVFGFLENLLRFAHDVRRERAARFDRAFFG